MYTFSLLAVQQMLGGKDLAILRVTSNPGWWVQYLGAGIVGVGVLLGLFRHFAPRGRSKPQPSGKTDPAASAKA
jgi:hypothetical protein